MGSNATIASGASLSDAIDTGNTRGTSNIAAIVMPAAWTAADLTFQASTTEGGTYNDVYDDDDAEVVVQAAASRYIVLDDAMRSRLSGIRFIKVRSGTTGTPVNQGAERVVILVTK